ncbi:hypothetical protein ACGFNV_03890 [Streptomyces sp. NPDC048751]|uniref:hypothetical protein n=1 Tax=Streptomyces sp. NPDC048751 TaxID=3365591 RepID=UPI00371FCF07
MPTPRLVPPAPNVDRQEKVALDFLRKVLATEQQPEWLRGVRHQHGVGADAVDALNRFYELNTTYGPEQDTVTLTAKECERAASGAESCVSSRIRCTNCASARTETSCSPGGRRRTVASPALAGSGLVHPGPAEDVGVQAPLAPFGLVAGDDGND